MAIKEVVLSYDDALTLGNYDDVYIAVGSDIRLKVVTRVAYLGSHFVT